MSFFLNYDWLWNENVFTIPKLHFFHATVPKLVLAHKAADVPHPLPCKISRSTRPQVLLAEGMWQYLHLCSKATLEGFNQINGVIIAFKWECCLSHFLSNWETWASHFSHKPPHSDSACCSLGKEMLRISLGSQFIHRDWTLWEEVDGYLPTSPFYWHVLNMQQNNFLILTLYVEWDCWGLDPSRERHWPWRQSAFYQTELWVISNN